MTMADPTTAGGGTARLRDDLCAFLWLEEHPGTMTWPEIVVMAAQHPRCMGALRAEAIRDRVDRMLAGPLARASAEQARAEAERDEARSYAEKAESEAEELRGTPWPEWAERCLKVIRAHSGYDGYDDAADGVDLPGELEETLNEYEAEAKRQRHEARAKHETDRHKAAVEHYQDQVRKLCGRVDAAESRVASLAAERDRLKAALDEAEACLSIVEPRTDRAEYLRTLKTVSAALKLPEAPDA